MPTPKFVEGKKFMWDGVDYPGEAEAQAAAKEYRTAGFEVVTVQEGTKACVYTRRVVTEVTVEGSPPV